MTKPKPQPLLNRRATSPRPKADRPQTSRLATLERMRDLLIQDMETADERVRYQIAPQLSKVLADIEALTPAEVKTSAIDELRARREGRAASPELPRAPRGKVNGA